MAVRGLGERGAWVSRLGAAVVLATLAPLSAEAAAPAGQWWNAGYAYR